MRRTVRRPQPDDHRDWLALVAVSGPFLALPVLNRAWPSLEAVSPATIAMLRTAQRDGSADHELFVEFVLHRLLGWGDALRYDGLGDLRMAVPEHATLVVPDFALLDPESGTPALLGLLLKPGNHPQARIKADAWPASPADRLARLCRYHRVPIGLVTDGRWFALVAAPPQGVTTTVVFDSATWPEAADRIVVRAFVSLLERRRFFAVSAADTLPALLRESIERQEEVTEALGEQVRRAVEMLVAAIGRDELRAQEREQSKLADIPAHEVYRAAVKVIMRVVFLLYAEERGLLPAENDLYRASYSVGELAAALERRAQETSEQDLEHSHAAWLRLLALCDAIHHGVSHSRLSLPTYDGPMFDPSAHRWLPGMSIDDRTMLHMLSAMQFVVLGQERRRLSFRALNVEQIGHVYERLLAYDARRAHRTIVAVALGKGREHEVPLADLERHRSASVTAHELAGRLIQEYEGKARPATNALVSKLSPPDGDDRPEALRLLLNATGNDRAMAERLLPFVGILRRDLRGLPVVIPQSSLYVTRSDARAATGTHYTPPPLAGELAEWALEDLVYRPGPADADQGRRLRRSDELLSLRIADIAVGSGAFLVSACRYLSQRLIEAWAAEGDPEARRLSEAADLDGPPADAEADPLTIKARRLVIERCLYGVDINPMAVEIAKLSLWLISMDRRKPFTFLDDRLVAGDSLLGITTLDQLELLHLDPAAGRALQNRWLGDPARGLRDLIGELATDRRRLAARPSDTLADVGAKQRLLAAIDEKSAQLRLIADLLVGAHLKNAGRPAHELRSDLAGVADLARRITRGMPGSDIEAAGLAARWLATDRPGRSDPRVPLHWPIVFADVFADGGFDTVLGNQPYLGGQRLTGTLGTAYREHLVRWLGGGARGSADLVAYFVLRSHELIKTAGTTGLIATNTLAQGDTREVGLARLLADGVTIRRACKSRPWPTRSAAIHVSLIKTGRGPAIGPCELDGHQVRGITDSLDAASRVTGSPHRLTENAGLAFIGSYVLGTGFTMPPDEARRLTEADPRNSDVLFPYLNGQDLNSRPDCSASRWVINFHDWPKERASTYLECFQQVERMVRPERLRNKRAVRRERWWHFAEKAPQLYAAIKTLDSVVAITRVSKVVMPTMVSTGKVFSEQIVVFATDDTAVLALLSSATHYWWAVERSSTLETRIRYTPSDVFETFPRPEPTEELRRLGGRLDSYRREVMLARGAGLTATYNLVHDAGCVDADITELRRIHVAIDQAVASAYGWDDLSLDHGFHETRQGVRHTVGPVARQEILDRLLELNHERYAAEQRAGAARLPRQRTVFDVNEDSP